MKVVRLKMMSEGRVCLGLVDVKRYRVIVGLPRVTLKGHLNHITP